MPDLRKRYNRVRKGRETGRELEKHEKLKFNALSQRTTKNINKYFKISTPAAERSNSRPNGARKQTKKGELGMGKENNKNSAIPSPVFDPIDTNLFL
jgi:hypothetical protein